jgi:hypothetical protein
VLAAMRAHKSNAEVQEKGCLALGSLATTDNQTKIADAGGIADVLAAMRAHRSNAGVQRQGCGALWCLALNEDNKIKIADAGAIADVLTAMQEHEGNSGVEDFACLTLYNLQQSVDGNVSKALLESGAVPAVQAATAQHCTWNIEHVLAEIHSHQSNAELQERGLDALWSPAVGNADKIKIADAGGIADVLAAMREHRSHAGVQERGCGVLVNLAVNAGHDVKIADAGGIADVLEAMREHKGNSRVEDFACFALHILGQSAHDTVYKALLELGAVPAVEAATSEDCKRWGQKMIDRLQERGAEL